MSLRNPPLGFVNADFNYIGVTYTSLTDVYTYRDGGASGTIVKVVTLTYSDENTKQVLASVSIV